MELNTLRILVTLVALAAFLAIAGYAYLPSRKARLDAEARRILEDAEQ